MVRLTGLATFFVLLCCTPAADLPANLLGEEAPYRVIPDGVEVEPDNLMGTWLTKYVGCEKKFGAGAKGKIDEAYYDAWTISNTAGVVSDIDWNHAAALEFLGAPGLNKAAQPKIQAVFANTATMIYSYKNYFFQHTIKIRCDDPEKLCKN
ncbi:hypothetical protein BDW68DRAFT_192642 [Aspergillus falconensis]